jgi:hypothetical protein
MVNSGVRGTKQERRPTPGPRLVVSTVISNLSYSSTVPSAGKLYCSNGTPRDVVASGSLLVLPRAAADTRGQYSALHHTGTGASIAHYAMQGQQKGAQERRREGGTRERGKGQKRSLGLLVVRQQELG